MTRLPNLQLSEHFWRHEVLYAPVIHRDRNGKVFRLADVNQQYIKQYDENAFIDLLQRMDVVRFHMNRHFISDIDPTKNIGLMVTSGWRCKQWEFLKGRNGTSFHTIAAVDVRPTNCSPEMAVEILAWMDEFYSSKEPGHGWFGGFAVAKPRYSATGELQSIGFAHYDLGRRRRWKY